MTRLLVLLSLLPGAALATDYNVGQCPVAAGCTISATQYLPTGPFSDTSTFVLGNWTETYGVYEYTGTVKVQILGENSVTATSGHAGGGIKPLLVSISSAYLDGIPMTHSTYTYPSLPNHPFDVWTYAGSLSPGSHTVSLIGTAVTQTGYNVRWTGAVEGITYTLVQSPPSASGQ